MPNIFERLKFGGQRLLKRVGGAISDIGRRSQTGAVLKARIGEGLTGVQQQRARSGIVGERRGALLPRGLQTIAPTVSTPLGSARAERGRFILPTGEDITRSLRQQISLPSDFGRRITPETVRPISPAPLLPLAPQTPLPPQQTGGFIRPVTAEGIPIPQQGVQGVQGTTASGGFQAPQQGTQGLGGGGSAFTGLLGAAGGATAFPVGDAQEEERDRLRDLLRRATDVPPGPQIALPPTLQAQIDQALQGFPQAPQTRLPIEGIGEVVDIGQVEATRQRTQDILSTTEAISDDDFQEFQQNIDFSVQNERAQINRDQPTPDQPVIDTPEQAQYERDNPGIRGQMDAVRQQVGLPALQATQIDLMKQLHATNQAFQGILDDIEANPDLPKGLARRRIQEVQKEQSQRINQIMGQLNIVGQQIDDANSLVNQEFEIAQFEATQEEKEAKRNQDQLEFLISSGAIGAFADTDLQRWSYMTGIPVEGLKAIQNNVNKPDVEIKGSVSDGFFKFTTDKEGNVNVSQLTTGAATTGIDETNIVTFKNLGGGGLDQRFVPIRKLVQKEIDKIQVVNKGTELVNQAERLYNEAVGSEYTGVGSGVLAKVKGVGRVVGGLTGITPEWEAYIDFLDSNRAPIAKGIKGEVGNLAENEQVNALKSFPGRFTTPRVASNKFGQIRTELRTNLDTFGNFEDVISGKEGEVDNYLSTQNI